MNWAEDRADHPLLAARRYFAAHSLGPVPRGAEADLQAWVASLARGRNAFPEWIARLLDVTARLERLIGAPTGSVALMPGATVAQGAIAAALNGERRHLVTTALDFHSSRYLWAAQAQRGFEIHTVPEGSDGGVSLDELRSVVRRDTAAVCVAHVSSFTGALLPVDALVQTAHDAGALVILDACQSVGIVPIDVTAAGVDVLIGCTHKWLGGGDFGLAFLYVRPELADQWAPAFPGWMGHRNPQAVDPTFMPALGAQRFQQSPVAMAPVFAARAGLARIERIGVPALRARSLVLTTRLVERARAAGLEVRTPEPARRGGHVCIAHPRADEAVALLSARGFDVDARAGFGVRIAPHPAQTQAECDDVVDALAASLRSPTSSG